MTTPAEALTQLNAEIVACTLCQLAQGRTHAVPGEGPVPATLMFIGEGPGATEDKTGRPFVGQAGKLLSTLLQGIGLRREDVFIANVVKCRPPGNRDPEPAEIEACKAYLDRQIEIVNPRVIVTLGRFSMARWFPNARITQIHGQPKRDGDRMVIAFFHPAAALRQPNFMTGLKDDFQKLPGWIADAQTWQFPTPPPPAPAVNTASDDDPEQLRLL